MSLFDERHWPFYLVGVLYIWPYYGALNVAIWCGVPTAAGRRLSPAGWWFGPRRNARRNDRLARARRVGLREYGALAQRHVREFGNKVAPRRGPPSEALVGSSNVQSLADPEQ